MKTLKLPLLLNSITVVSLFALLGCVNRGSHTDITTPGGDSGVGGKIMPPTDGPVDQEPPPPDSGSDSPDAVIVDNCDVDAGSSSDAGDGGSFDSGPPSSCTALYNFESPDGCLLYGAFLGVSDNRPATDGFTNLRHTGVAYCGRGGMAVDVDFDKVSRTGGEIIIPISRTGTDLTGKVVSIAVKGSVAGGPNLRFSVIPVTSRYEQTAIGFPITTDWTTRSATLPTPDASASGVIEISLQAHGALDLYKGTIYIDELDIRNPTASDGGTSDGPVDAPGGDARDAGAGDVRDAPAGS